MKGEDTMNPIEGLLYGLGLALTPELLMAAFMGALIGTLVGILPGLGPVAGAALVLPLTFAYDPAVGMIMIAGIYLGSQFGGSITSVLLNIPGDASSVAATFDGYPMTKKGRGGAALTIMVLGAFIAGFIGLGVLLASIPVVTSVALSFGPAEFFALTAGGLVLLARIAGGSLGSGLLPMALGLVLSTVGTEATSNYARYTFGNLDLSLGVALASVAVGIYGVSEIMYMLEDRQKSKAPIRFKFRDFRPTKTELKRSVGPWGRGSLLGFFFGLLPGPSATLSTFGSYRLEKAISKHKDEFGKGAPEGIAGPESANNAAAIGSIVPVLMLGLPFSATLALMISAMTVQGVQPGPLLMTTRPELFWSVVASVLVANIILMILNVSLISVWVRVLSTPVHYMVVVIILIAMIGSYSINNNFIDIHIVLVMGIVGYILRKFDFSLASLLVGLVLGPLIEKYYIEAMLIGRGDMTYLVTASPISMGLWILVAVVVVGGTVMKLVGRKRGKTAAEVLESSATDITEKQNS